VVQLAPTAQTLEVIQHQLSLMCAVLYRDIYGRSPGELQGRVTTYLEKLENLGNIYGRSPGELQGRVTTYLEKLENWGSGQGKSESGKSQGK